LIDHAAGIYRWLLKASTLLTFMKGGIGRAKKQLAYLKGMMGQVIKQLLLKDKA